MAHKFSDLADTAFKQIRTTMREPVVWIPKDGSRTTFDGIFDDSAVLVDPDTEREISSNVYTLGFRFKDLAAKPVKGDRCEIGGNPYKVVEVKEDGVEGVSGVLILHKDC